MYSYTSFIPGSTTSTARIINYVAEYNQIYRIAPKNCYCIPNKYDKNTPGSDSPSMKLNYANRISKILNYSKGGKTQYGNFYLGEPLNVNYLGRIQGMPGGSGSPPINRF
jgi:hypothetical protein